ncbi:MAG: hypothetical protein PF692_11540 [Kiritimatiellae bacterium]|nr:hypothetical protein [Kiritimatiellia bacterium]
MTDEYAVKAVTNRKIKVSFVLIFLSCFANYFYVKSDHDKTPQPPPPYTSSPSEKARFNAKDANGVKAQEEFTMKNLILFLTIFRYISRVHCLMQDCVYFCAKMISPLAR